jgi:hypothetical protein
LQALRESMLYVIRENYVTREEIINTAHKQYEFWSNLATENINELIKSNTPCMNTITLPREAEAIKENFWKHFIFDDPDNFIEFE